MIYYSETYEIITDESAEFGDAEERGFISEYNETDFRDMVETLKGTEPSVSPLHRDESNVWFTMYGERDMFDGSVENRSFHPKSLRDARYMVKAWFVGNQ